MTDGPVTEETISDTSLAAETPEHGVSADLTTVDERVVDEPSDGHDPVAEQTTVRGRAAPGRNPVRARPVRRARRRSRPNRTRTKPHTGTTRSPSRRRSRPNRTRTRTPYGHDPSPSRRRSGPPTRTKPLTGTTRAEQTTVAAEPDRTKPRTGHELGRRNGPVGRRRPGQRASLEAGAGTIGRRWQTLSLTVVDGWVTPDGTERQPVDDDPRRVGLVARAGGGGGTPAATWFPEAGLGTRRPTMTRFRWATRGARGPRSRARRSLAPTVTTGLIPPPWRPSEPAAGRSTIFQPMAGWASTADSAPASEPWSAWSAGQASADPVSASPPRRSLDVEAGVAGRGACPRTPPRRVGIGAAIPPPRRGERDGRQSGPEPVGSDSSGRAAAPVSNPAWGSVWQPPEPGPPGGDPRVATSRGLHSVTSVSPGRSREPGERDPGPQRRHRGASGVVTPPRRAPSAPDPRPERGWREPAPGDLHDPWHDLPQPGVASGQSDDAPPPGCCSPLRTTAGRPSPEATPRRIPSPASPSSVGVGSDLAPVGRRSVAEAISRYQLSGDAPLPHPPGPPRGDRGDHPRATRLGRGATRRSRRSGDHAPDGRPGH